MTTSTTEMPKLRLGDWVSCSAYIRPSGNHFEIDNEDTGTALLWRKDATEGEEIEDYESCEKFVTKTALFTGVFVGVTWLCTELFCEWNDRRTEEAAFNVAQSTRSRSPSFTTPRTRSGWCRWTALRRWSDELLRNL